MKSQPILRYIIVGNKIYLIGSLRNPNIVSIGNELRDLGFDVFDDWWAAGKIADDSWRDYEKARGHTYQEALKGYAAKHVFAFDKFYLNQAHAGVLVYPAGKSGHLELGHLVGQNKPGFILLDKVPDRFDVMKQFATGGVFTDIADLKATLVNYSWPKFPKVPMLYQHEIMWLIGLLESEGTFCIGSQDSPRLQLQMTDRDTIEKAANLFNSSVWNRNRLTKGGKQVWTCGVSGLTAIEWMRIIKPYMGIRRQQQILDTVTSWLQRKKYRKQDNYFWARMFGLIHD